MDNEAINLYTARDTVPGFAEKVPCTKVCTVQNCDMIMLLDTVFLFLKYPYSIVLEIMIILEKEFDGPGVAVDSAGNVYVTDYGFNAQESLIVGTDVCMQ
jgi:hypothetical protein